MTISRLSLAAVFLAAVVAPVAGESQQKIDVRRSVTPDVSVRLTGPFASLKVTGWAKDSLVLTGSLSKDARFEGATGGSGGPATGVKFFIDGPTSINASGTLELFVPAGATVWAKSGSASIDVTGMTGALDLNIVGGAIVVTGTPRELNIESMDGSVTVNGSPTWMRAKTASGDVTVRGSCTDLGITTVSGTVTIRDGRYERARVESVTGNVSFGGYMDRAGSLLMDSHSGTIELYVGKMSLDIEATTITGTISNGVSSRRPTPGRDGRGEELTLEVGTGAARATVRSFKGNIRLVR